MRRWPLAALVALVALIGLLGASPVANATPNFVYHASYHHPNGHQYLAGVFGVDPARDYDIVQYGGYVGSYPWTCSPGSGNYPLPPTPDGRANCGARVVCQATCPPAPPSQRDATRFELVDRVTRQVLTSMDVLSVDARFDRSSDVLTGRATPNLTYTVRLKRSGQPDVLRTASSDASGFLRYSFGTETGSQAIDVHAWDQLTIEHTDARANTFVYYVHQPRIQWSSGSTWVNVRGKPEGYVTIAVRKPDGSLRGTIKGTEGGDQGYVTLDEVPQPGDRIVLEDNGGVEWASMRVARLTADLDAVTRRVSGSFTIGAGDSLSRWRLVASGVGVELAVPGASNQITTAATFSTPMPSAGIYERAGWYSSNGLSSVESQLSAVDPDDHLVSDETSLPGILVNLDTGRTTIGYEGSPRDPDGFFDCPKLNLSDGRSNIPTYSGDGGCIAELSPVPAPSTTLTAVHAQLGHALARTAIPRATIAVDRAAKRVDLSYDTSIADTPDGRHDRSYAIDPTGYFYDRWDDWSGAACPTSGTCTKTLARSIGDGDVITVDVHAKASPYATFVRRVSFEQPFRAFYNASTGLLESGGPAGGSWYITVRDGAGAYRGNQVYVGVAAGQRLSASILDVAGAPRVRDGDTIVMRQGSQLVKELLVRIPTVAINQANGARSGTSSTTGTTVLGGDPYSPSASSALAVDGAGRWSLAGALDRCRPTWVTWITPDADRVTSAGYRWCYEAFGYARSSMLSVFGGDISLRRVRVVRAGTVLADAPVPSQREYRVPNTVLREPLRSGDTIELSGADGTVQYAAPFIRSYLDIGGDRVVGQTNAGRDVVVGAINGLDIASTPTAGAAGNGTFASQFGIHSSDPVDITAPDQVIVSALDQGNVFHTRPTAPSTTVNLTTGEIAWGNLLSGPLTARLICGTSMSTQPVTRSSAEAGTARSSEFARLALGDGCALATYDEFERAIQVSEVPKLRGRVDAARLEITTESGAGVAVTSDGVDLGTTTADANGTAVLTLPSSASTVWLSVRDRHGAVWRRRADVPAPPPTATPPVTTPPVTSPRETAPPTPTGPAPAGSTVIDGAGARIADPTGITVTMPPGAFTGQYLTVDPNAQPMDRVGMLAAQSRGFAAGSLFVNVTVNDAGDMAELDVHDLPVPIRVIVPVPASNTLSDAQLAPAWFADGRWRLSPRITPGVLPRELGDGYWVQRDASGARSVIFLTRHLTEFGVLRDVAKPRWGRSAGTLRVTRASIGRFATVRWAAASDAGLGLTTYRVTVNGRSVRTMSSSAARTLRIAVRSRAAARVCVEAADRAGNRASICRTLAR